MRQNAVLLADDNTNDVLLMQHAFEAAGISEPLIVVRDGKDAVSYLQGQDGYANREIFPSPTLLILDLNMPRMNGFDVLKWLQGWNPGNGLAIVVLSSSRDESDIQRALALGADDYCVKPSGFSDLVMLAKQLTQTWLKPHLAWRA